jgi:hypothetical protein
MKHLTLPLILICSAILFSTCHKNEGLFFKCKPENTIKIPQHAMDYFYFKKGSWWVYVCEQTGYRDSFYVKHDTTYINKYKGPKRECNCGWGKCFEDGGLIIDSKRSDSLDFVEQLGYAFKHYDIGSFNVNSKYGTTEVVEGYEDQTNLPGYKMNYEENNYYNPTGNGGIITEFDTLTVSGHLFTDIMAYSYLQGSGGYPDWYKVAWYGKNKHLVRYIKTDGGITR